jgi:hypothetical protein
MPEHPETVPFDCRKQKVRLENALQFILYSNHPSLLRDKDSFVTFVNEQEFPHLTCQARIVANKIVCLAASDCRLVARIQN